MSEIEIELDGETFSLSCTLGAFKAVSEHFGGFVGAFRTLAEVNIDGAAYIIAAGVGKHRNSKERERIVERLFEGGLEDALPKLTEYLSLLSAGGKKREEAQGGEGGTVTPDQFVSDLLKIGMGWIGWSEQQTLDTTIEGIRLAYEGRVDMLAAIFGKSKPAGAPVSESGPHLFKDLKRMAMKQQRLMSRKNGE